MIVPYFRLFCPSGNRKVSQKRIEQKHKQMIPFFPKVFDEKVSRNLLLPVISLLSLIRSVQGLLNVK